MYAAEEWSFSVCHIVWLCREQGFSNKTITRKLERGNVFGEETLYKSVCV